MYSPIIWVVKLRRMRWAGDVAHLGEDWGRLGKPEGKRPLGKPRKRWDVQWTSHVMGGYGENSSGSE
jgi:hypothetical protein